MHTIKIKTCHAEITWLPTIDSTHEFGEIPNFGRLTEQEFWRNSKFPKTN